MTRTKQLLGILVLLAIVVTVTLSIVNNNRVNDDYKLIRESVQSEKLTNLVTETKDLEATECYPSAGKTTVCKQIQYKINDGSSCTKIVQQLLKSDGPGSDCRTVTANRNFKGVRLVYFVGSQDGEDVLYVTYVSKD